MDGFRGIDLPGGRRQLAAPLATHRSWVNVRFRNAAIELTASFERAPGVPMSDLHLDQDASDNGFAEFRRRPPMP